MNGQGALQKEILYFYPMQKSIVILEAYFLPSHREYLDLSLADLESQGGSNVFCVR